MKVLTKFFALGMVVFWAVMTSHCSLESVPGFDFFACAPEPTGAPHQSSDCAEDADACATVESGSYRSEDTQIFVAEPLLAAAEILESYLEFADLCSTLREEASSNSPDPAIAWQFIQRTALPPRAPNVLS